MLLQRLGVSFDTASVDIDEERFGRPGDLAASVRAIAVAKFEALASIVHSDLLVTADTLVALDGEIMGKPTSHRELNAMLANMSGQTVSIVTGVCVGPPATSPHVQAVETLVRLHELSQEQIEAYVVTGVGMDKAGGLALQAEAGAFIHSVDGCWSNVVGLPICAVAEAIMIPPVAGGQSARCSIALCGGAGQSAG